nr:pyridoxamine 5'-phosphate oxidase family protein [Marivita sp. GX14005]
MSDFLDFGWRHLERGEAEPDAAARYPVLATVSPDGAPEARTVVLRRAERDLGVAEIYTDIASHKIASLRAEPRAQLHVWDADSQLQLRLSTRVTLLDGAGLEERWSQLGGESRLSYGAVPDPGVTIPKADAYDKRGLFAHFAVLQCRILSIELVHLVTPHKRAVFCETDGWRGEWWVP